MDIVLRNEALKALNEAFDCFSKNQKFSKVLKQKIVNWLPFYKEIPVGLMYETIQQFLNVDTMSVSFDDLKETGLYNIIYEIALLDFSGGKRK